MKTTAWIALALGCLSCTPGANGPSAAGPTVVIAPVSTGTAPAQGETSGGAEELSGAALSQEVHRLAEAALDREPSWESVSRLEIHSQFPRSGQVKDALARAGAPFTEDDWFGQDEPDLPERWEVMIGVDIDVAAAQVVLAACLVEGKVEVALIPMPEDEEFGNRRRIYVGPLNAHAGPPTPLRRLRKLLTPGISKADFYSVPTLKRAE